ncbi:MAG: peptidoglycan-associated lipoprotein [Desulfobulbus propionicus]|nr:MAG: peptidoglycan-associated lipoprotein [Desulfobulbus propionicus]
MPEGKAIDYSNGRGTITEELGPSEESLDAAANGANVGSLGFSGDMNSDEYKQIYGRSSSQMQPVYFDFDQATIRGDQIPRIEHNAEYLRANPAQNVVIEGNCDDRGTNEYNLALGERRAQNAKNYLVELGIEEYRIRTVSYGEERPLFSGQTDADLSHNRRDDFILE